MLYVNKDSENTNIRKPGIMVVDGINDAPSTGRRYRHCYGGMVAVHWPTTPDPYWSSSTPPGWSAGASALKQQVK